MHPADDNALVTEEKIWDLTQNINVKGVWYGCKHAIIAMRQVSPGFPFFFSFLLFHTLGSGSVWIWTWTGADEEFVFWSAGRTRRMRARG